MLTIKALADLHGVLPEIDKNFDYLFLAGDLVPLGVQSSSKKTKKWIDETFIPWLKGFKKVIMIAGNHDLSFEKHGKSYSWPENVVYLENEYYEDENLQVYGTPLCKIFGNWAYMVSQVEHSEIFDHFTGFKNDSRLRIILSHDAPYGTSDVILDTTCPWYTPEHIGNPALRDLISRTEPDYNIHGHLHSTNHNPELLGSTKVVCVSYLGEDYKPAYEPFTLEV